MARIVTAVLFIFLACALQKESVQPVYGQTSAQEEREWRLVDGKTFRGSLEKMEETKSPDLIRIRTGESLYEIDLKNLSPADREYVRSQTETEEPAVKEEREPNEWTVVMPEDFRKPGTAPGERRTMIVNGTEFRFCWCPPGTFMMGTPEDEEGHENYETSHQVTLSKGFWLLESEVTQQFWFFVTGRTIKDELNQNLPNVGGVFESDELKKVDRLGVGDSYPIYFISWNEADQFCAALSEKTGLAVSLPTEAQWEYACRAGTLGPFAVTNTQETELGSDGVETTRLTMTDPSDMCWYIDNSGKGVHPVKQRVPNAWGLYDMHGNLWEMCADRYSKDYYSESAPVDPKGPSTGGYRVNRGGCWFSYLKFCRSACRYRNAPDYRYNNLGFRIAVNL